MAITFHCEHCGKKIEAPDSTGGKWAKCPRCHNKIYIPDLSGAEELKLAPVDETEEEKKKRLMAETFELTQEIIGEKETPEGDADVSFSPGAGKDQLTEDVILYLRYMADGELDAADGIAKRIASYGKKALEIIDKIAVSDIPEPELADIPQQVLSSLIKNLRAKVR